MPTGQQPTGMAPTRGRMDSTRFFGRST
jgi:hypothetical protein